MSVSIYPARQRQGLNRSLDTVLGIGQRASHSVTQGALTGLDTVRSDFLPREFVLVASQIVCSAQANVAFCRVCMHRKTPARAACVQESLRRGGRSFDKAKGQPGRSRRSRSPRKGTVVQQISKRPDDTAGVVPAPTFKPYWPKSLWQVQ